LKTLDIKDIARILPHRYPFQLVDKVLDYEEGKTLTAVKNVTINEPFFQGHFPGLPVMPGVLILEALAQATGLLGFKTVGDDDSKDLLYVLVSIDGARFKRQVVPGDVLILEVEFLKRARGMWKFACEAKVDGELAVSATIMCAATQNISAGS